MVNKPYQLTRAAKITIMLLFICFVGLIFGFMWEIYDQNDKWDKLIYPGIKVAGIDLSGKTKEEGINLIKSRCIDALIQNGVNVIVNGKTYIMDCSRLIWGYDVDGAVDNAIAAGKSLSFLNKYQLIKQGMAKEYDISFKYNDRYLEEFVGLIERDINTEPANAGIVITYEGNIEIIEDVKGYKLQAGRLGEHIKENIESGAIGHIAIEAPVEEVEASVTADQLHVIDTKLSSFSTSFASSSASRIHNIELAAQAINGSILMPGQTFSFNDYVGERTKKRGYAAAPVLEDGNYKPGIGGGICQVSTTLYRAALDTGAKIIERRNHGLPSSYIGLGLDATVSWGNIDLKFQNTLDYPIFIEAYAKEKNLNINIYSNSNLSNRTYIIRNEVYAKIPAEIKIIEDSELAKGSTVAAKKGSDGYKVKVTRETYEKGILVNSEIISNDYYRPINGIIRKGIKDEI